MNSKIASDIASLIMTDPDFEVISQLQDVFCPFEALGVARQEIRHSNFLSYIISPDAPHGFGDIFLRSFLEALLSQAGATALLLELHLDNLSEAQILREWRHIDILIRLPRVEKTKPDLVFVVELKIEAREHSNQLEGYEKSVREKWPNSEHYFFYLTPNGASSSRQSWVDVSFSAVLIEFEKTLKLGEGLPDARSMTGSYIAMMRRRYVEDDKLLDLASKIWSRHRLALEFLIENQPNIANDLQQALTNSDYLEQIHQRISNTGNELTFEQDTSSSRYLRLAVRQWDTAKGMKESHGWVESNRLLLLEIEFHGGGVLCRWAVGPGPQELRRAFIDALEPNRQRKISDNWTRIASKTLVTRSDMEKLYENDVDEKLISKLKNGVISYVIETAVKFDSMLRATDLLR